MRRIVAVALAAILLTGCATASQRYVSFPSQGQTVDQQITDREQCESIASSYRGADADTAATAGVLGAARGVVTGALYGAAVGFAAGVSAGHSSVIGLAVGGVLGLTLGLVQGVSANQARYHGNYAGCMMARGYVLGG